jgi:hypothetical protein
MLACSSIQADGGDTGIARAFRWQPRPRGELQIQRAVVGDHLGEGIQNGLQRSSVNK